MEVRRQLNFDKKSALKIRLKNLATGKKLIWPISSGEHGFVMKEPEDYRAAYPEGNGKKPLYALDRISQAPADAEVWIFLLQSYSALVFSKPCAGREREGSTPNPKRAQRLASRAVLTTGIGTKAQQALKSQYEANKEEHKALSREQLLAQEERKFQLRQEKKKAKHRGH